MSPLSSFVHSSWSHPHWLLFTHRCVALQCSSSLPCPYPINKSYCWITPHLFLSSNLNRLLFILPSSSLRVMPPSFTRHPSSDSSRITPPPLVCWVSSSLQVDRIDVFVSLPCCSCPSSPFPIEPIPSGHPPSIRTYVGHDTLSPHPVHVWLLGVVTGSLLTCSLSLNSVGCCVSGLLSL